MKKYILTILTASVVTGFLVLMIVAKPDSLLFSLYPYVDVRALPEDIHMATFTDSLNQTAFDTDSLIARRVVVPVSGGRLFKYAFYGNGDIPQGFVEATQEEIEATDPANAYLILRGNLSKKDLAQELSRFTSEIKVGPDISYISRVLSLLASPAILLSLFLFLLIWLTLLCLENIRLMRSSGIRILSGIKREHLLLGRIRTNFFACAFGAAVSILFGIVLLQVFQQALTKFIYMITVGAILYCAFLFLLSLLVEILFMTILKHAHLVDLLKGKMPIRPIIALLLVSQFLALLTIGYGVQKVVLFVPRAAELLAAQEEWENHADLYTLSMNTGAYVRDAKIQAERDMQLTEFADDAIQKHGAIFVKHNLNFTAPDMQMENGSRSVIAKKDILFVSPSFLDRENIAVDAAFKERMHHLNEGEFGLILPRKMNDSKDPIQREMETYITNRFATDKEGVQEYTMKAHTTLAKEAQSVFIYNQVVRSTNQYISDPCIVVITPKATGRAFASLAFWASEISPQLFVQDTKKTEELLKKHHVFPLISALPNALTTFEEQVENYRNETVSLSIGSIIGLLASAGVFIVMNRFYFNYFRKEIFIRRVAGVPFFTNHRRYLLLQLAVFALAPIAIYFITQNIYISAGSVLLFMAIESLLLYGQMKRENRTAVNILKGAQ